MTGEVQQDISRLQAVA